MVQITLIRRSWVASGSVLRRGLSEMHDPHPPACPPPSGAHSCKNCGTAQKRKSLWWSDANTQSIQREIGWTFSERFPLDLLQIALEAIFQQHSNSALGEAHKIYCGRFYCYHLMRISTQIGAFIKRRTLRWLYTDGGWGRWPLLAVAAPGPEENPTRRRRTHKNMHDAAGKINKWKYIYARSFSLWLARSPKRRRALCSFFFFVFLHSRRWGNYYIVLFGAFVIRQEVFETLPLGSMILARGDRAFYFGRRLWWLLINQKCWAVLCD